MSNHLVSSRTNIDGTDLTADGKLSTSQNVRYVYAMARTHDPARKPALLAEIVEFLLDKPLGSLTFRTLATGLGVSTYALVYHFGTRAEMLREVMVAIAERQDVVLPAVEAESGDMETHLANIRTSWRLGLEPRSRELLRLEFEAAMLDAGPARGAAPSAAARVFDRWHRAGVDALVTMGLERLDAELEARVIVDTIYGLQYDHLVTRDTDRVTMAFERALAGYEQRVRVLLDRGTGPDPASGTMGAWPAR